MSTLDKKIYTALTSSTYISDYVGTKVYPVTAPQGANVPHIIYTRISGGQINGLSGYQTAENPSFQFDIYSTSYDQARTISGNLHTAMNATTTFGAILVSDSDIYEDQVKLYRTSNDYSIINLE